MSETTPKNNAHCSIPGDPEQSINRFIVVAAKRARQLQGGARSFLPTSSNKKVTTIAMEEVRRGLIKYEILPAKDPKASNCTTYAAIPVWQS
jgi:DNA-directed RNA polymerase subunit omega